MLVNNQKIMIKLIVFINFTISLYKIKHQWRVSSTYFYYLVNSVGNIAAQWLIG